MSGGFLLPCVLVVVVLYGREALDPADLHVAHPLGLPEPRGPSKVCGRDGTQCGSQSGGSHRPGGTWRRPRATVLCLCVLLFTSAKLSQSLMRHDATFSSKREAAQRGLLLLFQGPLAGREDPDVAASGEG